MPSAASYLKKRKMYYIRNGIVVRLPRTRHYNVLMMTELILICTLKQEVLWTDDSCFHYVILSSRNIYYTYKSLKLIALVAHSKFFMCITLT